MKYILSTIIGIVLGAGLFGFTTIANANPSQFTTSAQTATATSTRLFMTPGTATTTVMYDTFESNGTNQTNNGNTNVADSVTLLEYLTASSTATVLVTKIEYSEDAIDWYENNLLTYAAGAIAIVTPNSYTWTYASTTPGGVAVRANENRGTKAIEIKVPTRYVRAVLSLTGANGAVWAKILPKKQKAN